MGIREAMKSRIFWLTSILIAVIIFVVAGKSNKIYQAETSILFLPKTEMMARNFEQVVENAKQIPLALSFYDKLVEKNPEIEGANLNLLDAERKEFWHAKIETKQVGKSGIVNLALLGNSPMEADLLSHQVTSDLLIVMSRYYNIKTDLDMRIIDGPIVSETTRMNSWLWVLLSLIIGLIVGFLGSIFFSLLKNIDLTKFNEVENSELADEKSEPADLPKVSFSETRREKSEEAMERKNIFNFEAEAESALAKPRKAEFFMPSEKKAAAPANLPIAEEEFAFKLATDEKIESTEPVIKEKEEREIKSVDSMIADAAATDATREATPEEVKERLNKLLKGDMLK